MSKDGKPVATSAVEVLDRLRAGLPKGEERPGQVEMARAVEEASRHGGALVVEAGTGTGKSLGYLSAIVATERRAVVATSTINLQEQLVYKDLPFIAERLGLGEGFYALLKGRSNYLCRQKLAECAEPAATLFPGEGPDPEQLGRIRSWAETTEAGDKSELDFLPTAATWGAVSSTGDECPGAGNCPMGESCFAERARGAAEAASVIVANTHLYAAHVASRGRILPEHEVIVFDEGHEVEPILSHALGGELRPGHLIALANTVKHIVDDEPLDRQIRAAARQLGEAIAAAVSDERHPDAPPEDRRLVNGMATDGHLKLAAVEIDRCLGDLSRALDKLPNDLRDDAKAKRRRAERLATTIHEHLRALSEGSLDKVIWVENGAALRSAPLSVGDSLMPWFWRATCGTYEGDDPTPPSTVVFASATVPDNLPERVGAPSARVLRVGSPFDYRENSRLYVPLIPSPKQRSAWQDAVCEELQALISAAQGRTLALFTSNRSMHDVADALRPLLSYPVLVQGEVPKPAMIERLRSDPHVVLMATRSFFQGVDVPGQNLSLVVLDRLPFPRPNDPLVEAWKEAAQGAGFSGVVLPLTSIALAQAAGRLIRTGSDRGVVAVLDSRLATERWRTALLKRLPPMRRTRDRDEVVAFLRRTVELAAEDVA